MPSSVIFFISEGGCWNFATHLMLSLGVGGAPTVAIAAVMVPGMVMVIARKKHAYIFFVFYGMYGTTQ